MSQQELELECMYDGCSEGPFESHNERLRHSMREHHNINPKRYPEMTGQDNKLLFD